MAPKAGDAGLPGDEVPGESTECPLDAEAPRHRRRRTRPRERRKVLQGRGSAELRARGRRRRAGRLRPRGADLVVPLPQGDRRARRSRATRSHVRPSGARARGAADGLRLHVDRARALLPGGRRCAGARSLPPGGARRRRSGGVRARGGGARPGAVADHPQHHGGPIGSNAHGSWSPSSCADYDEPGSAR